VAEVGAEKYVLDNRFENVYNLNFDNGYKYDKIQATGGSKTWLEMSQ
jgi:predicted transglutaminase-like cysteine proteinase